MTKKKTAKKKTEPAKRPAKTEGPRVPGAPDLPPSGRITSFEETIAEQKAKQAAETAKRGRGRPRKEPPIEPGPGPGPELTDTAIKAGIKIPFNLWAEANKLDELKLLDNEVQELAVAVKGLVDFYCPDVPVPVLLWSNATLTLAAIMAPRLEKINKIKKEKEKAAAARGQAVATGPGTAPAAPDKFPTTDEIQKTPSS